jgi:hypothetical protein
VSVSVSVSECECDCVTVSVSVSVSACVSKCEEGELLLVVVRMRRSVECVSVSE